MIIKKDDNKLDHTNLYHVSHDFYTAYKLITEQNKENYSTRLQLLFLSFEIILKSRLCLYYEIEKVENFYSKSTKDYSHGIKQIISKNKDKIDSFKDIDDDIIFSSFLDEFQKNFISIRYGETLALALSGENINKVIQYIEILTHEIELFHEGKDSFIRVNGFHKFLRKRFPQFYFDKNGI